LLRHELATNDRAVAVSAEQLEALLAVVVVELDVVAVELAVVAVVVVVVAEATDVGGEV